MHAILNNMIATINNKVTGLIPINSNYYYIIITSLPIHYTTDVHSIIQYINYSI